MNKLKGFAAFFVLLSMVCASKAVHAEEQRLPELSRELVNALSHDFEKHIREIGKDALLFINDRNDLDLKENDRKKTFQTWFNRQSYENFPNPVASFSTIPNGRYRQAAVRLSRQTKIIEYQDVALSEKTVAALAEAKCEISPWYRSGRYLLQTAPCKKVFLSFLNKQKIALAMPQFPTATGSRSGCNTVSQLDAYQLKNLQIKDFYDLSNNGAARGEELRLRENLKILFTDGIPFDDEVKAKDLMKFASENILGCDFVYKSIDEIANALPHVIAETRKQTLALPADTTVFHWSHYDAILYTKDPLTGSTDKRVQEYLTGYTTRFWKSGGTNGLYFAIDPNTTHWVGPVLMKVTIRGGTRYVNNYYSGRQNFSQEAIHELEKMGCKADSLSPNGLINNYDLQCKKIGRVVARKAGVGFMTYGYSGSHPHFCKPTIDVPALIVFDPNVFIANETAVFDDRFDMPAAFMKDAQMIASFGGKVPAHSNSAINALSPDEFEKWGKAHLFDCGWSH